MSQDALKQYANQIRKKAEDVNDDKYLLAIADAVEKGNRQLSAAIEALIQTRLEHLKLSTAKVADTVNNTSEIKEMQHAFVIINKRLQLLEIAFQKQTDLFVTLFGITKEAQEILNKSEEVEETQPGEPFTTPDEQPPAVEETSPPDLAEEEPKVPEGVEEFKPGN